MGNLRVLAVILLALAALACGGEESEDGPAGNATAPPSFLPLAETAFSVEWGVPGVPAAVPAGSNFAVGVRVKNTGDQAWMDPWNSDPARYAAGAVRLGYRWWKAGDSSKPYSDYAAERGELLRSVMPGHATVIAMEVTAPPDPGDYRLQFDLVQELVSWFEPHGAAKLFVPVKVGPQVATAGAAGTGATAR
jgi:hypothetical protein